ncbi:histidinol-phosphate aminotransferase [Patiriisocius marinistellae]|uniref:Histidinol-phosphate aminotransferase n=1 Tax=Patiriisocius marinistellae TaxID=2494560 RepID=A0A5J4G2D9_9FLAO|nr:histidinol-phosphate transaminase [Patiriisocius marinistellae]GEQ86331.1 histidinol-phosphate aminotransferase [Patiriisocius marinistellae]
MKLKQSDLDRLIRPNVANLKPYSSARDEYKDVDGEMIFLDANENPFENGVNRYPDPQQRDVKALLAAQKGINTSQLLLGNGSDEVLDLLFRAFCEPNKDNIITLPPTYGMYNVLAGINAIENREILLNENFEPNVTEILKIQDNASKILFICSPNNPTGNSFSIEVIVQLLTSFNGIVVIDEAYIDFSENESWISKLSEYPNLVVTQTLSKAYGLAGIRLGICYASPSIIEVLNKIKPPYNVNELTQQRAFERLVNIEDVMDEVEEIMEQKEILIDALEKISFIKKVYASDANFLLLKVDDATIRYNQLIEKGIVVRNRSTQPLCENTLRITVGKIDENKQLIQILNTLN